MYEVPRIHDLFALGERIGRGAWGDVLRARDLATGEVVAVKRMHSRIDDPDAGERFRREARLLASVESPYVVGYRGFGEDEGRPCLVVEWLDGEDLARRKRRAPLPIAESVELARQAALGLAALHDAGIVHRDMKPSNVFLVPDGLGGTLVKLIDLGVARGPGELTLTVEGSVIGTPFYMAPEQARGLTEVGPSADLFGLGVVLFELIAGERPFTGDDMFAVLAKIVLQDAPRLSEVKHGVSAELDALLAQALARSPEQRFPSARAFADALGAVRPSSLSTRTSAADTLDEEPTARVSLALSAASEQRVVTALFVGFAPWATGDGGAGFLASIASQHGGTCHPTLDRHVVAVFGEERTAGDEALRAARAALLAAASIHGVRLSIATGRALAGASGLAGDVIERGAALLPRADEATRAGRGASPIHVDAATARLLAEHFVLDDDGRRRVLRSARGTAPLPRTLVGRPTTCVGRERELALLDATITECLDEPVARAVIVTGPAGIGKSRLRHELLLRLERRGEPHTLLFGRGGPLGSGSPFGLLGPALRRLAGVLDGEAKEAQHDKLEARVALHLGPAEARELAPVLAEIAGLPRRDETSARADAGFAGERVRTGFLRFLAAECDANPVVVVLDDAHWGDVPTMRLMDAALRELADKPLFVLVLGRPELEGHFPRLFADRGAQELRVGPLTPKASERLVREILGVGADPATVAALLERAEGNAFFLEELVRAVAEGARDGLPDTVLGMVQARLDALGAESKRVLRAASVMGQTFWLGGVSALLGGSARGVDVVATLSSLAAAEIITRRGAASFPGEDEYTFRHALVREAAYATLTTEDRLVGHRLAGLWLERMGASDPALLAEHFELGGAPDRAASFHLRAAEKALFGNDFAAAITHADKSAAFGEHAWLRGEARLVAAEALRWSGELADAAARAADAVELLTVGESAWFHALREAIAAHGRQGNLDEVRRFAELAMGVTAAEGALGAHVACLVPAAVHLRYVGDGAGATRFADEIARIAARPERLAPEVLARLHQLHALTAQSEGDLGAAVAHHERAIRSFERAGDRRGACLTLANLGSAYVELGSYDAAEAALRRALEGAERMGLSTIAPLARQNLGAALAFRGRLDEALAVEQKAHAAFLAQGDPRLEATCRVYLAMIRYLSGSYAWAEAEARRVATSGDAGPPQRAMALAWMARALLALGRSEEALAAASEATALVEQLGGLEELEAVVPVALAEALAATGQRERARVVARKARSRLLERAERLTDPAMRARFMEVVPHHARCLELADELGLTRP
jgi:tetratricopeptide (TPR) repeat protein